MNVKTQVECNSSLGIFSQAEIVSIPSADSKNPRVTVLFIDYGNKEKVFLSDLRELPPTLRVLPSQAVWFKLAGFKTHPDTVERTVECFQHPIIKMVVSVINLILYIEN